MRMAVFLITLSLLLAPGPGGATKALSPELNYIREKVSKEMVSRYLGDHGIELANQANGRYIAPLGGGFQVVYTVEPCLQQGMTAFLQTSGAYYAAFLALEPSTGRVLALVNHSPGQANAQNPSLRASYPAASLFKLVTAAAALERGKLSAESKLRYRGHPLLLTPAVIKESKRDRNITTFQEALGKSNNVVFGRLGLKWVGREALQRYAEAFFFNRPIPFEMPVEVSQAHIPGEAFALARTAAGFQDATLSPLHAAMLAGAIANDGVMMKPYLVEGVATEGGEFIYRVKAQWLTRAMKATPARELKEMMRSTITVGTSSRIFKLLGKELTSKVDIGAKTGTLDGGDPPGRTEWFVGVAPLEKPEIAVAALVVNNGPKGGLKGNHLALEGLKLYFTRKGCRRSSELQEVNNDQPKEPSPIKDSATSY